MIVPFPGSRGTRVLGTFSRRGFVGAGMSYSRREKVSIPRAIFGNYSIVVVTDVFNYVYEHLDEDDNSRAALVIIGSLKILFL